MGKLGFEIGCLVGYYRDLHVTAQWGGGEHLPGGMARGGHSLGLLWSENMGFPPHSDVTGSLGVPRKGPCLLKRHVECFH